MKSPNSQYRWLILPIENFVREFYGKLLLGAVAAERGWATIVAHKGQIKHRFPAMSGVLLDIYLHSAKRLDRYLQLGLRVCAADEEGLIYRNGDEYFQHRVDRSVVERADYCFMWGEAQRSDILQHLPGAEHKLVLSGNPRFDLLRPDLREVYGSEAARLQQTYGKYILINTNFAYINHFFGENYVLAGLQRRRKIASEDDRLDQLARGEHERGILDAFCAMLPVLSSSFPDHKIIIRPHPSENFGTWSKAAANLPNILVIHEGDVVPWLMGASVLVHNSCTTGLQAYVLDRPVVAYMPMRAPAYDQYLPNAVSRPAYSIDELTAMVGGALAGSEVVDQGTGQPKGLELGRYISGLEGSWAAERIMDRIQTLEVAAHAVHPDVRASIERRARLGHGIAGNARRLLANLRRLHIGSNSMMREKAAFREMYQRQRWPGLTSESVEQHLEGLRRVTHRFGAVRWYLTADDWLCIFPS